MAFNMSHAKLFLKTGSKLLDAVVNKRSMLVKPTKRKLRKEVLQRLDHEEIKEYHRRSAKGGNGIRFFKKQLEKINISQNLKKSSHTVKSISLRNTIPSEDSSKVSRDQRLRSFGKLSRNVFSEKTSKTEGSLEAKQCPKVYSSSILARNEFQYNHCRKDYLQSLPISPLVEATRDVRTKNSSENSRKTLNRQHKFEVPRRNLRSNSSQYNGCGIYNKNKSIQIEDRKTLGGESLLCLKRSRKSAFQATSLPNIT